MQEPRSTDLGLHKATKQTQKRAGLSLMIKADVEMIKKMKCSYLKKINQIFSKLFPGLEIQWCCCHPLFPLPPHPRAVLQHVSLRVSDLAPVLTTHPAPEVLKHFPGRCTPCRHGREIVWCSRLLKRQEGPIWHGVMSRSGGAGPGPRGDE